MNKKVCTLIGWILLIGIAVSWIAFGYSNWYLLLVLLSQIAFSIGEGRFKKVSELSMAQVVLILVALAVSVGVVFGSIQLVNFIINDKLHVTGSVKTVSQIIAVIFLLYPVKFIFGYIVYKVLSDRKNEKS